MEDRVPFIDLRRQHAELAPVLRDAYDLLISRGAIGGEALATFETDFAGYCESEQCAGVASGTAALRLALTAAGIGPGDEVILPSLAGIGTAAAVIHSGATPVLCDVRADTGLIDIRSAAEVVSNRTAAVIAIHLHGQPCDMDEVATLAQRHRLLVVEETAQAVGARFRGRRVGSLGDVAAFRFDVESNLGSLGSGGAVCSDDASIAERVRTLRNLGRQPSGEQVEIGFDELLDELQAVFLGVKLERLEEKNAARRVWAELYKEALPASVTTYWADSRTEPVHGLFPVRVSGRGWLRGELRRRGIQTHVPHWPALHQRAVLAGRCLRRTSLDAAEEWSQEELCLPVFPELTRDEVSRVGSALATLIEDVGAVGDAKAGRSDSRELEP